MDSIILWSNNIHNNLRTSPHRHLFLLFFLVKCIYAITTSIIATWIDPSLTEGGLVEASLWEKFFFSVILGPIIETLIFQFLIIELLLSYNVRAKTVILVSALVFATTHYYNFVYIIVMFFSGLLYAYYYYILQKRNKGMAILWVTLLHAAWNFIAFLNNDVLKWF